MEYTQLTQDCYGITLPSGEPAYRIETAITDAGELTKAQIFVYTVATLDDPATDTFTRVGTPQDIHDLLIDRDDAIAAGDTEYLSSTMSLQYSDLNVAIQAKEALRTRINQLIRNWVSYRDDFEDQSGVTLLYPTVDPDLETSLKTAYADARDARIAAEEDVVTTDTALTLAKSDVDNAILVVQAYEESALFCTTLTTDLAIYVGLITSGGGSEEATATAYRVGTLSPLIATYCADMNNEYSNASNTLASKRKAVEAASTAKVEAVSTLAVAQAAEDAALAAIRAVCPTFDPASV